MTGVTNLREGMRVRVGRLEATVDEIGLPQNIAGMKGYSFVADDGLLEKTLRAVGVTRLAFLALDGVEKQIAIVEYRGYWWEPLRGDRLEIVEVGQ